VSKTENCGTVSFYTAVFYVMYKQNMKCNYNSFDTIIKHVTNILLPIYITFRFYVGNFHIPGLHSTEKLLVILLFSTLNFQYYICVV